MLEKLFDMFSPSQLVDDEYHTYLTELIMKCPIISYRLKASKIYGKKVIAPLIKSKKYTITDQNSSEFFFGILFQPKLRYGLPKSTQL